MASPLEDCCGLGCNNCILDRFLICPQKTVNNKFNLFNKKSWTFFRVKNITKERPLVYIFTFELPEDPKKPFKKDEQLFAPPVSYLMLRAERDFELSLTVFNSLFKDDIAELIEPRADEDDDDDDTPYFRSQPQRFDKGTPELYFSRKYTPYEVNEELRTFKIIVRLEKSGKMSRYFAKLRIGSLCEFKGPYEAFNYEHEKIENYMVFTQGISIVAAFRLVKEIIYESAQTRIVLISCFKNLNETFLREDFFKLTSYWCLKHHIFLSENVEPKIPHRAGERIHNERLNEYNFKRILNDMVYFDPKVTQVLIAGRPSFVEYVKPFAIKHKFMGILEI